MIFLVRMPLTILCPTLPRHPSVWQAPVSSMTFSIYLSLSVSI